MTVKITAMPPYIDNAVIWNEATDDITILAVNKSFTEDAELTCDRANSVIYE